MNRTLTMIAMMTLSVLLISATQAEGQEFLSRQKVNNDTEISTICSDNKVFLIVKSKERVSGIKQAGVGIGIGVTQVLEEKDGILLPKTCE